MLLITLTQARFTSQWESKKSDFHVIFAVVFVSFSKAWMVDKELKEIVKNLMILEKKNLNGLILGHYTKLPKKLSI